MFFVILAILRLKHTTNQLRPRAKLLKLPSKEPKPSGGLRGQAELEEIWEHRQMDDQTRVFRNRMSFPAQKASDYGLLRNQLLSVKYNIVDGEHPHRCAINAQSSDDCWGLGIRVSGTANQAHGSVPAGGEFEVWLKMKCQGTGRKAVKMANTIVDFVSGIPPDTEHTKADRYYRRRSTADRKKTIIYT